MKKEFPELPEWSFEIEERSAGVYHIVATQKGGRSFDMNGTDYDVLLAECREEAAGLSGRAQFERR
jgi:hypothetical protein